MIYLIHGNDSTGVRKKLHELLAALAVKKPNAEVFRVTTENWSREQLDELVGSQGLFEHKYIVVLDSLLPNKEISEVFFEKIDELKESDNAFILVEGAILAAPLAKIEKRATKTWEVEFKEQKKKEAFNVFALTDALGRKDKKTLWTGYNKAILNGSEPEELHGLLFWQVKSMLMAIDAKDAESAGQKPFVWSKSKGFLNNFTKSELEALSASLVDIYHRSRRGLLDFDVALEKYILSM